MAIPLDKAMLLALFLETIFYGIFLTLFMVMLVVLFTRTEVGHLQRRTLVPVGFIMLGNATTHLVLGFIAAMHAFVLDQPIDGGATAFYANISNPYFVGQTSVFVIQTFIGDAILIWRAHVVWGKRLWLLVPLLVLLSGSIAVGFAAVYFISQASQSATIFATSTAFITAHLVMTMGNCVICTGAVAWKIYFTNRQIMNSAHTKKVWPIVLSVADSGALYTAGVAAQLIAYLSDSNGMFCSLDILTPLIGITFCLIFLQIRYHLDFPSTTLRGTIASKSNIQLSAMPPAERGRTSTFQSRQSRSEALELQPVQVHVSHEVHYDEQSDSFKASSHKTYVM